MKIINDRLTNTRIQKQAILQHQMTTDIGTVDNQMLREQELFKGVNFDSVMPLIADCRVKSVAKNEVLIEAGETNQAVYLVTSGSFNVHLTPDPNEPLVVLKSGESIGEMSVIDHHRASAFVSAAEDSEVLVMSEDVLWSLIGSSHAVANNLLVIMARRLRHGNSSIKRVKGLIGEYEHNATIDALTGLYNRRWLDSMFTRVMQLCIKNKRELCVMMIDIDGFKGYNDQHGHLAGDIALRSISQKVARFLREEDLVTRYGGEEFLVLLPGLTLIQAASVAERLREEISVTKIVDANNEPLPSVTISIGLAEMKEETEPQQLIGIADKALYRAKHAGRNRVCH